MFGTFLLGWSDSSRAAETPAVCCLRAAPDGRRLGLLPFPGVSCAFLPRWQMGRGGGAAVGICLLPKRFRQASLLSGAFSASPHFQNGLSSNPLHPGVPPCELCWSTAPLATSSRVSALGAAKSFATVSLFTSFQKYCHLSCSPYLT